MRKLNLLLAALCWMLPINATEYVDWHIGNHPESGGTVTGKAISPAPAPYRKTVLIIEGFDTNHGNGDEKKIDDLENELVETGLKSALMNMGYTIVLVDLDQNWADLVRNSKAVGSLMQSVWISSTKVQPISVVGLSMGGLIATLACKIKEYHQITALPLSSSDQTLFNSWNFRSNLTVTFDSPHKGAYIPTGLKAYASYFADENSSARQYQNAFASTASHQMLLMPIMPTTKTTRNNWQDYYNGYLEFLKSGNSHRLAGIVKGSWKGDKQYANNNGVKIIDWHYDPDLCGEAWADIWTQGRSDRKVGYLRLDKCFPSTGTTYYDPPDTHPNFENAPGGYLNGWESLAESMPNSPTPVYTNFSFIPTFSAAALDYETFSGNNMDNFAQKETTMGPMVNYSGLHHIYTHTGGNQSHLVMDTPNAVSILNELRKADLALRALPSVLSLLLNN